ncbi:hypothetical protein EVAR_46699_1 [Eumeta japonica]|uniref:Uncharacterized protein n=1 Tax=Eumeta variegata TaxID=151549 RepID=A0A4C1Y5E5_EUMVA|nr:hypothetical protein EVAR_46699_1 [Eumeta japonica]
MSPDAPPHSRPVRLRKAAASGRRAAAAALHTAVCCEIYAVNYDCNSFVSVNGTRSGRGAISKASADARGFYRLFLQRIRPRHTDPTPKTNLFKNLCEIIAFQ